MSKENNLKDYLVDLYRGIASKKPGASKNPQDFRAEIESIVSHSAECLGEHVINVSELPTENIDERAIYRRGDVYYRYEEEKTLSGIAQKTFSNEPAIGAINGEGPFEFHYVKEKPEPSDAKATRIRVDGNSITPIFMPMYYVEKDNDIFIYINGTVGEEYVRGWLTFGQAISVMNSQVTLPEYTFQGCISSIDEAENVGYYAIIGTKKDWKSYGHPCVINVDELPAIETRDDTALYCVSEEECVDVGIYDDDGQYMSIIAILSALLEVQIQIFNVPTLDVVADPIPYPLAFYYCKADRMLYSWDDEEGIWDPCDGKDEDSLGIPGWQTATNNTYYKPTAGGFTDLIIAEGPIQMSYKQLSPNVHFHTIDTVPEEITDEYEKTDENAGAIHLYYAEQDRDVGVFVLDETTSEYVWMSFLETENIELTGVISRTSEITGDGVYVLMAPPWEKYIRPSGTLTVMENNKTFDATDYESVTVSIPSYTGRVVYE